MSHGPLSVPLGSFRLFSKIRRDNRDECLSAVSMTPAINCSATRPTNLLAVSLTPAINLCHGFSVIAGVVDTGEQFITGDNDTAITLSPVTTTLAITLSPVTTAPVNNYRR